MIKGVQVVGYKGSGKSTFIKKISAKLKEMGCKVTIVKHACHELLLNEKDRKMVEQCERYIVTSNNHSLIYIPAELKFLQTVSLMTGDVLIVEGFKNSNYMPQIVCYEKEEDLETFKDGASIAFVDKKEIENENKILELVDIILNKGFLLAGLDCGDCGHSNCAGLLKEILEGKKEVKNCIPLNSQIATVKINGNQLPLSPFVAKLLVETYGGFLKGLKGVSEGTVEIKFDLK